MSPQEWPCLDSDVSCAFPPGRYAARQVTGQPGAALSSPSVPLREPASLTWPSDPQGSACFGSVLSEELPLKITALCGLCTHRLICSSFQPCKPFNTWAVEPDDALWVSGVSMVSSCHLGVLPWNSLTPGLKHLLETARSRLLIPRAWPENHCPSSRLTPCTRPIRPTLLIIRGWGFGVL